MTLYPYIVEQDLHGVWHFRKISTRECVGCVESDLYALLMGWFHHQQEAAR